MGRRHDNKIIPPPSLSLSVLRWPCAVTGTLKTKNSVLLESYSLTVTRLTERERETERQRETERERERQGQTDRQTQRENI